MKANIFKIVMPVAAILLAIGGSLSTHASEKKNLALTNGYITPIGQAMCSVITPCQNVGSIPCTVIYEGNSYSPKGKFNPSDTSCIRILYRLD